MGLLRSSRRVDYLLDTCHDRPLSGTMDKDLLKVDNFLLFRRFKNTPDRLADGLLQVD